MLFPLHLIAQMIHFDGDEIQYNGSVSVPGVSVKEVQLRLHQALPEIVSSKERKEEPVINKDKLTVPCKITLSTPFHLSRQVHFTMQVTAKEGAYTYNIDKVYLTEKRRGGEAKKTSSEDLLKGMEETGNAGAEREKLLNEIDMRFQKLLAQLEAAVGNKKIAGRKNSAGFRPRYGSSFQRAIN